MNQTEAALAVLKSFDISQNEPIRDEREIGRLIKSSIDESRPLDDFVRMELLAFNLLEISEEQAKGWNAYFNPPSSIYETGEIVPSIPFEIMEPPTIDYWESRIGQCSNPVLKARYCGLVWEFSKRVRNTKPDFNKVGLVYIESLLGAAEKGRFRYSQTVFKKLARALELSIKFNQQVLKERTIELIISYEQSIATVKKPLCWIYSYQLLVENKSINPDQKYVDQIVGGLETKLLELSSAGNGVFLHQMEAMADSLLHFYRQPENPQKLAKTLFYLGNAYEPIISGKSAMRATHYLEKLYKRYKDSGMEQEADPILRRMQQLSPAILQEMKPIPFEFSIPKDKIDFIVEETLKGEAEEPFIRLAMCFIPKPVNPFRAVDQNTLWDFIGKSLHDNMGRKTASVGSRAEDISGNTVSDLSANMTFLSISIQYCIVAGKQRSIITADNTLAFLKKSCLIREERLPIIMAGIRAYLADDYVTCLHLLIPQIEASYLYLLQLNGGQMWREGSKGGYNLRLFEDVLRDSIIVDAIGEDVSAFLRVLFTDQRGWNLRNKLCHGMLEYNDFNAINANFVFLALLGLGLIDFADNTEPAPE